MKKIRVILFSLLLLSTISQAKFFHGKSGASGDNNPPVVSTAVVKKVDWQPRLQMMGHTVAKAGVAVSTDVSGIVSQISFHSGEMVKKGQPLAALQHDALKATVASDQAELNLAKSNYQRYQGLLQKGIISKQDANLDAAYANQQKAFSALKRDQAELKQKYINAPFSGRLGIRQVSVGQYLSAGDPIVSLQQLDPMYVDFDMPENQLRYIKVGGQVVVRSSATGKQGFSGNITALGDALDEATHTLPVRAEISNKNQLLLPGMYVNVDVLLPVNKNVLVVPQTAVTYHAYGDSVYVVEGGKIAEKYVKLGDQYNDKVIISRGLKVGDQVVIAGQNKLHDDIKVKVDNHIVPDVSSDKRSKQTT